MGIVDPHIKQDICGLQTGYLGKPSLKTSDMPNGGVAIDSGIGET
jgi:hypothetical protein